MERKKRKRATKCNQRLLGGFFFIAFSLLHALLAAQAIGQVATSSPHHYKIEQQHPATIELEFLESLVLSFKINTVLRRAPQIIVDSPSLKLYQSRVYHTQGATIVEAQYKLLDTGHFKIIPLLLVDGFELSQEEVEMFVQPPSLFSGSAQCRVRLFEIVNGTFLPILQRQEETDTQKPNTQEQILISGKKYLLVLEGFFKSEDGDEINVQANNHTGMIEDGFFLEKIDEQKLNLFLSKQNSEDEQNTDGHSENKNIIPDRYALNHSTKKNWQALEDSSNGWKALAFFYFYPLKSGKMSKMEWNVSIKRKNGKSASLTVSDIPPIAVSLPAKENQKENEENLFQGKFRQEMNTIIEQNKTQDDTEQRNTEIATKIKMLRNQERKNWFAGKSKKTRKQLEEQLGVTSFEPFNLKWFTFRVVVYTLLIFSSVLSFIVRHIKRQKALTLFNIASAITGLLLLSLTLHNADFSSEYTHVDQQKLGLHSFASEAASLLGDVKTGETVRIVHEHRVWNLVEKADGKRGWIK